MGTAVPELQTSTRRRTLGPQAARWILILGLAGLTIEAGTPFYIFLARDLVLQGPYADQRTVARQR